MEDNFDDIKNLWQSGDHQAPDIETVKEEILQLRKVKKDQIIRWYLCVSCFAFLVVFYVIYTDDLHSIYKSISEFILLFTGVSLLYHSWKSIRLHQKEYLLNGHEFLHKIKYERINDEKERIFMISASLTLFITACFLYFFDFLMISQTQLIVWSSLLGITILAIWLIIFPYYRKKSVKNSTIFINTIERLLQDI